MRTGAVLVVLLSALCAAGAAAQELEPRAYSNAPVGLNFLIAAYTYTEGGVSLDPTVPLTNAQIAINGASVAYARSLGILGKSAKFDVVLPYAWLSGSADFEGQPVQREVSGWGNPRLRVSMNFFGAPALSMKEFADYRQDLILGASLYVWAPWGQYDSTKLVNIAVNRWAFKAEFGMSKALGAWTLELVPGVTFFTDNTEFLGGQTRAQDPVYSVQAHVIYGFASGIWVALDGTYFAGGRTSVDGVPGNDRLSNSRAGLTVALPVDRSNSIKLYANSGVSTRAGGSFDTLGIAWQHRWGGGI